MNIFKKTALYFARKEFCRAAIYEHADLSIFEKKLTSTVIVGLIFIAFSNIIGLPALFILAGIAAWMEKPVIAFIGIPLYGISWLLFVLGMYLAGPKYWKAISRWAVRIILEKILGNKAKAIVSVPVENPEKTHTKQ